MTPDYKPELRDEAKSLYEQGLTLREVAERMNLSHERVRVLLIEAGVELRPPGPRPGETNATH